MANTAAPAIRRTGSEPADKRRVRRARSLKSALTGWSFVAPATIIILGLSIFPAVWAFILSLQSWDGFSEATFVGGANYAQLVSDADFWNAVGNTFGYTILFVPASVLLGLFLAVALNRRIRW